jgi:lysozyme
MDTQKKMLPNARPQASLAEVENWIKSYVFDRAKYPLFIVGFRGYYEKSMGDPTKNDRNIYDDAAFMISPNTFRSFNYNTDPSAVRKGRGTGAEKGMLSLKANEIYFAHKFGFHRNKYLALVQRMGTVKGFRDGIEVEYYPVEGSFGANIHKGVRFSTGSEGCQTVPPTQWDEFIDLATAEAKVLFAEKWDDVVIPYILIDKKA